MPPSMINSEELAKKFVSNPENHKQCEMIWALSKMGLSNRNIADNENISINYDLIRHVLKEIARERVDEMGGVDLVRVIESSKLDDLTNVWATQLNRLKKKMNEGIEISDKQLNKATDMLLKIAERKARLLGLDAPVKHQVNLRVFDQFTVQLIEIIQAHCSPEVQKRINSDINRALQVAEKYRSESEEEAEWTRIDT